MPSRIFKQTIIAIIFLVILALVILALYFLFFKPKPPSPDENGEVVLKKIQVLETAAVQVKDEYYDLVAKIKNPNSNYGVFILPYQFKLYGENQKIIQSKNGETFILPASTKYIVETKITISEPVEKIELIILEAKWKKFEDFQPELFIRDKRFQLIEEPDVYAQASGILYNVSPFDLEEVKVNVVLRNKARKIIALNSHKIFTLSSNEERYFAARWFSAIDDQVVYLEMEPEFNVFVDDNFIKRYGILEKFQEF